VLNASLTGLGKARALFLLGLAEQLARVVMLTLLSWTHIELVAIGTIGVALVYAAAAIALGARLKLFTPSEILASLLPALAICVAVGVAGIAIDNARGGGIPADPVRAVVEAAAILALVWLGAVFLFQRAVLKAMWKVVRP